MRRATISEAKNTLSALIDVVREGDSVEILDRKTPVARLVPIPASEQTRDARIDELVRRGIARAPKKRGGLNPILAEREPAAKRARVRDALRDERDER